MPSLSKSIRASEMIIDNRVVLGSRFENVLLVHPFVILDTASNDTGSTTAVARHQ